MARDSFRTVNSRGQVKGRGGSGSSKRGSGDEMYHPPTREVGGSDADKIPDLLQTTPDDMADAVRAPVSLVKRALKRKVHELHDATGELLDGEWVVEGNPKLGDKEDWYNVVLPSNEVKYICDCYGGLHGDSRRSRRCSHVVAVILCRRGFKLWEDDDADDDAQVEVSEGPGGNDADNTTSTIQPIERVENTPVEEDAPHSPQSARQSHPSQSSATPREDTPRMSSHDPEGSLADEGEGGDGVPASTSPSSPSPSPSTSPDALVDWVDDLGAGNEPPPEPAEPPTNVIPLPTTTSWMSNPPMPAWFRGWREGQEEAVEEVVGHFQNGIKVVFLDAPTGAGKSALAEGVRRKFTKPTRTSSYSVVTKSLQEQLLESFDYARVIKGKANYSPLARPDITCDDCDGKWADGSDSCSFCPDMNGCPYVVAKRAAVKSELPVLNMAYFLAETSGALTQFGGRRLAILDEGDELENQLRAYYEVVLSPRTRAKLGVTSIPKKTVPSDWKRWINDEMIPAVEKWLREEGSQGSFFGDSIKQKREVRRFRELKMTLMDVGSQMEHGDDAWILTGYERARNGEEPTLIFKPVTVAGFARNVLWNKAEHFLVMSATLISAEQMADELGLEDGEWAYVRMDSSFPPENRPIIYRKTVAMSHKTQDTSFPVMRDEVERIIAENPGCRILVHTVSYKLGQYLYNTLTSPRVMTYHNAEQRQGALEEFLKVRDGVMLAPSFERGIDLPGDKCEVIIIPKIPFANLGDKQISARFYSWGGRLWFAVNTIRSLAQMTGRGMRSKDDTCDVYLLDNQFTRLLSEWKKYFPSWWLDALVLDPYNPKYKPLIAAAEERRQARLERARVEGEVGGIGGIDYDGIDEQDLPF